MRLEIEGQDGLPQRMPAGVPLLLAVMSVGMFLAMLAARGYVVRVEKRPPGAKPLAHSSYDYARWLDTQTAETSRLIRENYQLKARVSELEDRLRSQEQTAGE